MNENKMINMKSLLSASVFFFVVFAHLTSCCRRDEQADIVIADAQHLLDVMPDSSLVILDGVKGKVPGWPKSQRMQYELVLAQAQNKAFVAFSTDSVVLELADYYEDHGSSSDRMKACYMVGCAYRDLGDAPSALKYMNMAVDAGKDADNDEDRRLLLGVHSQLAYLYETALAFDDERVEDLCAEQLAWQLGDTLSALQLKWHRAVNLYDSKQQLQALSVIDTIETFARTNNHVVYPYMIYMLRILYQLQENNIQEVERLLAGYERGMHATLASPDSDIDLAYFLYKGRLFNMKEQPDSAIIVFRRLLTNVEARPLPIPERNGLIESSYRYLAESFKQKQQADSVLKYSELYCALNDSTILDHSSEQLLRMQSLYNYSKIQEQALLAEQKVSKLRISIVLLISVVVLALVVAWFVYHERVREERRKQIGVNRDYQMLLEKVRKSEEELSLFKVDAQYLLKEKEAENKKLQNALAMYRPDVIGVEHLGIERLVLECEIATHLHAMSAQGKKATKSEFEALLVAAQNGFPNFYSTITAKEGGLTVLEIIICVLIRFHFIPSEIVLLTGRSSQRITNIKSAINKKVFGEQGAKTLDAHLMELE